MQGGIIEGGNKMDNLEKVEKLREKADVSYEEARRALEDNNWDLLDAIVSLEKQGKTKAPDQTVYSTSYEDQKEYVSVKETIKEEKQKKNGSGIKGLVRRFVRVCKDNSFIVTHKEKQIIQIPVFVLVILLLVFWHTLVPVMIIALFFHIRYSFTGKDDLKGMNDFMTSAGNAADQFKEGFKEGVGKGNTEDETINGNENN